jgi:hypothetical protein
MMYETRENPPKYSFDFRQRILILTHQWPYPLATFFIGALLALGVALLIPSKYAAETRLGVAYHADAIFRNSDDFKNWEIGQLNTIIFSAPVLDQTLQNLQTEDAAYWGRFSAGNLYPNLHVYWQNVGTWRLVATAGDATHASQLVRAWEKAALQVLGEALSHAAELTNLNLEIQAITRAEIDNQLRLAELTQIQASLGEWQTVAGQGQSPDELQRWRMQYLVAQIDPSDDASLGLLQSFPAGGSSPEDYTAWIGKALAATAEQIAIAQSQAPLIAQHKGEITQQWQATYAASQGLSSYLHVETLPDYQDSVHAQRSNALMALIGGLLGFLAWTFYWLALPFWREKK